MKKFILLFLICLLCIGCSKQEKNIIINIYENSEVDKKEETKIENKADTQETNNKIQIENKTDVDEQIIDTNTQNNIEKQSTLDKVKDTYNSAEEWYNENKDELKDINSEIIENDKNTINSWIDKTTTWYSENKEELKNSAKEIYNEDKETIKDLYNKIKG